VSAGAAFPPLQQVLFHFHGFGIIVQAHDGITEVFPLVLLNCTGRQAEEQKDQENRQAVT
jgi:hypothetical protein